jgi:Acyl dehydratase
VGLTYQLQSDPFGEGFIALERLEANAKRPVKIGDTISAIVKVVKKEDRGKNGRINISVNCVNQRNETVMEILLSVIVNKKHQT